MYRAYSQDAAGKLGERGARLDVLVCGANRKPQSVVKEMVLPLVKITTGERGGCHI